MNKVKSLLGQRFGRLTVSAFAGTNKQRRACWLCTCDCGNKKTTTGINLTSGNSTSCGCLKIEMLKQRKRPSGPNHSHWKGGRSVYDGYVVIWVEGIGRIKEHIHIMQQHLGRKLLSDESVHHKNGNRSDNRFDNLELRTRFHSKGQAATDQVEWATEILRRYAPTRLTQNWKGPLDPCEYSMSNDTQPIPPPQ